MVNKIVWITIGTGATLTIDKTIQLDSNYKLYNIGTINTENLICANSSVFFNAGSVNIKDKSKCRKCQ